MQTRSAAFATMVAGNDLVVENQVTLALPEAPQYTDVTLACESLSVQRSLTTTAPQQTRMITGYPAASATVALGGLFDGLATRTNLCTNPNFETNTNDWSVRQAGTIARTVVRRFIGSAALRFTSAASNVFNCGPQYTFPTVIGQTYTVSGRVFVPTGTPAVKAFLIGGTVGASTTVNDAWVIASVTFVATAASSQVAFGIVPTAANQIFDTDAVLIEQSAIVDDYFDGSNPSSGAYNAKWTGTPNGSTSTEQMRLDGSVLSALDLYNPYNPASPVYRDGLLGNDVVIKAGLWVGNSAPELLTSFTGLVDSYEVDPVTGLVTFTCLDYRNKLRSVPSIPQPATEPFYWVDATTAPPFVDHGHPGLTSLWVIDSILRQNGIYASPPVRANAVFASSQCGSAIPQLYNPTGYPVIADVGSGNDQGRGMVFVPGRWTPQVPRDCTILAGCYPSGILSSAPPVSLSTGGGLTFEGWFRFDQQLTWSDDPNTPAINNQALVNVFIQQQSGTLGNPPIAATFFTVQANLALTGTVDQTAPWLYVSTNGNQYPIPGLVSGWHQLTVQVSQPTANTIRNMIYVDGVLALDVTETQTAPPANANATSIQINATIPSEAIQLTGNPTDVPGSTGFVPTAIYDPSLNPLHATIDLTGQDPWAVIQQLAEAEYAVAGFDELGTFRFTNRQTLKAAAPTRTISSTSSLRDLALSAQTASEINRVVVPINAVSFSDFGAIYAGPDANTAFTMPAHSTYPNAIQTQFPVTCLSTIVYTGLFPEGGPGETPTTTPASGWRSSKKIDGSGAVVTSGVGMVLWQSGSNSINFNLTNTNAFPVYFVTPTGNGYLASEVGHPFFVLGGKFILFGASDAGATTPGTTADQGASGGTTGTPTVLAASAVSVPPANAQWVVGGAKEQALQVPANPWIQDPDAAQQLAEDLLEDMIYPRPIFSGVSIVADPSAQLSDRVTILDPDASLINDDAVIFGSTLSVSQTAWDQSIDLRAVAQPGYWVLGVAGKSELGQTTWV